jgi:hypothetical protein
MAGYVLIADDAFELRTAETTLGDRRRLDGAAQQQLAALAARYALLEQRPDPVEVHAIGRDFYRWLDGEQHALRRLLDALTPPLLLTVHCPSRAPSPAEWALLYAPWELLADEAGFLAADALRQFSPLRRLGPVTDVPALDAYRLGLAFMAAAPEGVSELDYEAEEAAILDAVGTTALDLVVEESGAATALGERLADAGGLPVLHLSCHGQSAWQESPNADPRPVLLFEDGTFGHAQPTDAAALLRALRPAPPRLLFLSACLSATAPAAKRSTLPPTPTHKQPDGGAQPPATMTPAQSLTGALIQAGMPAVLGWDGSVADRAATTFAAALYAGLARRETLADAVAEARRALLLDEDENLRSNWHLARLWVGSGGDAAAPLVAGRRKRSLLPADHVPKALLGKDIPVASHALFVGRRRELQAALRHLGGQTDSGVLLTGMGRLGKSSLAARIANRRRDAFALAVLYGRFGILDLVDALSEALRGYPAARELLQRGQAQVRSAQQTGQEHALRALEDLLTDLLQGPCQQRDDDGPALLLVLDDFEQLLEKAAGARPVQAAHAGLIAAVLRAFDPAVTDSRLLITSRFPFRLDAAGEDLVERLARIELGSFRDTAERKLTLRQQDAAQGLGITDLEAREAQLARARAAARGNPGLLDLLVARLLLNPAVPLAEAEAALTEMETYLAGGALPAAEALRALLEAIAVDALLKLAGAAGRHLLQALSLFQLPVPRAVADVLAAALGGDVQRLFDLALLEPSEDPVAGTRTALRVSPLAAGRLEALDGAPRAAIADLAAAPLFAAWGGEGGARPPRADLELVRLARAAATSASAPTIAASCGAGAIRALEAGGDATTPALAHYRAAADCAGELIGLLEQADQSPGLGLLAAAARVLAAVGEGKRADALLAEGLAGRADTPEADAADALALMDEYANRLYRRGELDEALRIRIEEELPVYERLGDVRAKAVTQGKIADIAELKGHLDWAIRTYVDDVFPAYEQLGDTRLLIVDRANLALKLLRRQHGSDRAQANELLCLALADAHRLRIPEAAQIEQLLEQAGMTCSEDSRAALSNPCDTPGAYGPCKT